MSVNRSAYDRNRKGKIPRKIISTRDLLGSAREMIIEHGGEEYRLRITSNQKLILTK